MTRAMHQPDDKTFTVTLKRSGETFEVAPGETILDVLLLGGVNVPNSCQQGVCGSCETAVISGRPDHRDELLSDAERAAGKTMLICCSRSLEPNLTLDL